MRFTHGKLSLDVPENWADISQLAFMAPTEMHVADDIAKREAETSANAEIPGEAKSPANLVLSVCPVLSDVDPKEFCTVRLQSLLTSMPNTKASELTWIKIGDLDVLCADLEIKMEDYNVRQFRAVTMFGGDLILFCGTSSIGDYDETKSVFVSALESLTIEE